MRFLSAIPVTLLFLGRESAAFQLASSSAPRQGLGAATEPVAEQSQQEEPGDASSTNGRRQLLETAATSSLLFLLQPSQPANAVKVTGPGDGLLGELPPDALRSYLQYRFSLQLFADFFMYDLQRLVADTDDWGEIGQLFQVNNNRGQGQPSRIEREFTNPVRILGLGLPPEYQEPMFDAQIKFERGMAKLSKVSSGIRRDLPVEIDKPAVVKVAQAGWEESRLAINEVFGILNEVTGLTEMKPIPPPGPNQNAEYGRSPRRYYDLVKKTKLCQNRGGPALSQAWGQLMVSGYLQDSCGIPPLDEYFYQT